MAVHVVLPFYDLNICAFSSLVWLAAGRTPIIYGPAVRSESQLAGLSRHAIDHRAGPYCNASSSCDSQNVCRSVMHIESLASGQCSLAQGVLSCARPSASHRICGSTPGARSNSTVNSIRSC